MGKKTYASSSTVRMMQSADFRSSNDIAIDRFHALNRGVLRVPRNGMTYVDCLLEAQKNTLAVKFNNIYKYAEKKEDYCFGKPKFTMTPNEEVSLGIAFVNYLKDKEDSESVILGTYLGERNLYHSAWEHLVDKYEYNSRTNELVLLSVKHGTPVYLTSSQMYVTQATVEALGDYGCLEQFGLAMSYGKCFTRVKNTTRVQPAYIISDSNRLTFTYSYDNGGVVTSATETFDLAYLDILENEGDEIEDDIEVFHAMYEVDGKTKWFSYDVGSGLIPELEHIEVEEVTEGIGNFYPRIYTRIWDDNVIGFAKDSKRRKSTENIVRKLGFNLKELTEQIHGQLDVNDDLKFVYLHLSIGINNELNDEVTGEYFFKYFSRLYNLCPSNGTSARRSGMAFHVKDTEYTQTLSFQSITKRSIQGSKLDVGSYRVRQARYHDLSIKGFKSRMRANHIIYYQEDEDTFWEITIDGLKMKHHYAGGNRVVEQGDSPNLCIPVDRDLLNSFTMAKRELLINRGFQITVSHKKVVKTKWYESSAFKIVVAIISIAANFIVPGSGFTIQALMTAVAVTIATTVAINVAINVLVKVAISLGMSAELIAIIAAIATLVAMAYSGGQVDLSRITNAKALMSALNTSVDVYQKQMQAAFKAIQEEIALFDEQDKQRQEKLTEAQALLNTGVNSMEMELLNPPIRQLAVISPGETPDEFERRMSIVDVSDISEEMIVNYVPMALSVYANTKPRTYSRTEVEDVLLIN